jgi:hypothetical protein
MDQQQLEALLAQMGALGAGDFREETKQEDIPNPASTANGGLDPSAPLTIKGPVVYRTWVKPGTNQRLTVKVNGDGTYTQAFSGADPEIKPAGSTAQAAAPGGKAFTDDGPEARENGRRWGWNPDTKLYDRNLGPSPTAQEIIRNRSLPADQDPRAETDAERAARAKETIARQDREAQQNRGTTTLKPDGKGGTIAVTTYPDGRTPTTAAVPGVPTEAASKYKEVKQDPNTGAWSGLTAAGTWEPISGGPGIKDTGTPAEPAGGPPASQQYGAISESLVKYRDFLNQQVLLHQKTGGKEGITADQADRLMNSRLAQAKATVEEQSGVINTQTGIYGSQVTQRGQSLRDTESRRNAAKDVYTTTLQQFTPLLKYMPAGGGQAFLDLLSHGVDAAQAKATAWGGMRESPEVQLGPAAAAANRAPMPGSGQPITASAGAPRPILPYAPGTTPVPTQGTFLAPFDPAAAATAQASQQAAEAQLAAGRPPALMVPPAAAAPAPIGAPASVAPAALDPNVGHPGDSIMPPAINPATGEPTGLMPLPGFTPPAMKQDVVPSQMPVDVPYPDNAGAQSFLSPYQQQRSGTLDSLLNDPWIGNDVVARAYEQVYGHPLAAMQL